MRVNKLLVFILVIFPSTSTAFASDWGYEEPKSYDTENSIKELSATAGTLGGKSKTKPSRKSVVKKKTIKPLKMKEASLTGQYVRPKINSPESAWLQILGLVAPLADNEKVPAGTNFTSALSKDQKTRFLNYIRGKLRSNSGDDFRAISGYWPTLVDALKNQERKANYRLLFRSLLRLKAEDKNTPKAEKDILLEAIGPTMIAETKPPTLSSEAIDAYADMACFLYGQTHPGKTVDFDDNRKLFALVTRDKFRKAPSYADRLAMSYFPVNWAKFRILYLDATDVERKRLVQRLAKGGKGSKQNVKNALLEKVLSHAPWKGILIAANRRTQLVGQKAKVRALSLTDSK